MKVIEKNIGSFIDLEPVNYEGIPEITGDEYKRRIDSLLKLGESIGLTHIVVYGDREHFSNMEYLTKYDPRFEEALLILSRENTPVLVVGNEGLDYSDIIPFEIKIELYQNFNLMGQPRRECKTLKDIFSTSRIAANSKVGVIGWKYFSPLDFKDYEHRFEVPHYIVETLAELADRKSIVNAGDMMISNDYGLRHKLDAKELILHEFAGTKTSRKVLNFIKNLREGISEIEASENLCIDGDPLCVHPTVNFGETNVLYGLASPTYKKRLSYGEPISVGLSYRRANVHRMGLYGRNKDDMTGNGAAALEHLFKPYFKAIVAWYEKIAIGVTGGEMYNTVKEVIGDFQKYGIGLNPGHQTSTEEWTNSLFYEGSQSKISSGTAIQCDIIAAPKDLKLAVHIEDGIVVADEALRREIQKLSPQAWNRIIKRRKMMKELLGINLSDDILPTSDLQGIHFPYMANTQVILARE